LPPQTTPQQQHHNKEKNMGEAKRGKGFGQNNVNPPLRQGNNQSGVMRLLDMDDITTVITTHSISANSGILFPRKNDCLNRSLHVSQRLPGSKVQAGQIFFWDYKDRHYDIGFNFHMWIVKDGQIYDCFDALEKMFHSQGFSRLKPGTMTVRFATKKDKVFAGNKTTDAVYCPGLDCPNRFPNNFAVKQLLHQTKEHGHIDVDMAFETFKVPRQQIA